MNNIVIIGPNIGMGGVEKASCTLANALNQNGNEVTYIALIPEAKFFNLNNSVQYLEPTGFNTNKMSLIKTLAFIRKNIKTINPNGIIAYTKFYASLANLALICTPYKVVFSERSSPFYKWPFHINLITQISILLKKPKMVIAQTQIAANYQKEIYKNTPIVVIPNIIKEPQTYASVERENIILCVGRFNDSCKGFDMMIQAFNQMQNKTWELHFAGGTKEEAKDLIKLIDIQNISRVKFLGKIEALDDFYAKAGIFVIPSRSEGFPNALVEAMFTGTPSISFDFTAGPRDIITDGVNGCIVKANDTKELAKKIDYLIENKSIRDKFSSNAKLSSQKFSEKELINQYQNLFI